MARSEPVVGDEWPALDLDEPDLYRPAGGRHLVRWIVVPLLVMVVMVFTVVAWNRFGRDPSLVDSPLIGRPAPELSLLALDPAPTGAEAELVRSADLSRRLYVVNFWASWCVPCREEAPVLERFYEQWSRQGVGMVGVVYADDEDDARAFREEFGLTYPQAMDPDGRAAIDYGAFGIPETFVVDERGIVMAKLVGAVEPGTLDEVVAQVMAGETYTAENDDYRTGAD